MTLSSETLVKENVVSGESIHILEDFVGEVELMYSQAVKELG